MSAHPSPNLEYRPAVPEDVAECIVVRGKTRQNAFSEDQLRDIGITSTSWAENVRTGAVSGYVCIAAGAIVGFCFGMSDTGEIAVVAILPDFEGRGIGKALLGRTSEVLATLGHTRLFLGCSPDPDSRSYGFYRHLGWRSTGTFDQHGDEILEIFVGCQR
jgi:GNAT superfamily N-acetyltransferase